jgi:hypothetical protein
MHKLNLVHYDKTQDLWQLVLNHVDLEQRSVSGNNLGTWKLRAMCVYVCVCVTLKYAASL